ncbi:pyridoxal phosphate-dependent aminotransferase [Shimazuella sp. AN120528]|uniref:pyridoxal phosphate-dependent aminotransferase n=1 Tax=Shimazuella soli TaxID=1892854 RepID=UPI001F0F68EA|nr:pyridoxal phosphate-dependent aminotransferase [Shimazuella soli]MCH5585528.1 pyridoxal phosphate-dependent aminotransferase [Shimazuella soli]
MTLSDRVKQLSPSPTLAITATANALKQQGHNVVALGAGEPDFNTPEHILTAAKEAMDKGFTKYTASGGIKELKDAVIAKFANENGLTYTAKEVMVTVGGKEGLYNLFQVILNEGDEVIIPAPYWVSYIEQVKLAGGKPIVVDGKEENNLKITAEQLEAAITDKTKAIIINSPSNPTGMIYSKQELLELGNIAVKHDLLIVSDEIYEHLIYDNKSHVSIATLDEAFFKRTIIITGVSKTYAMTGWRIGYAAGPQEIIQAMTDLQSHSTSNPTSVSQYAAIAALTGPQEPVIQMKAAFKERRDYVINRIRNIKGFRCITPPGAFYAFIHVKDALGSKYSSVDEWSTALLKEELVAVVPGSAFGADEYIRISYATSMDNLKEAFNRIEHFVNTSSLVSK